MSETDKQIHTDYINRINRVFEYIDTNLGSDLSLNTLAEIACFSPYHFHRIFKFVTGETLNEYIIRRRIEKSALDLLHKTCTITHLAHQYGFSDNSSYSKAFKKYFNISPTLFKKQNPYRHSKIRQLDSKIGQEYPDHHEYIRIIINLKNWLTMNAKIEVKETSEKIAAGLTHVGVSGMESTFQKLLGWASEKDLMNESNMKLGRVFHDSFKVTEPDKVRMSIIFITSQPFEPEGEINKLKIKKCKCIVGRFEIRSEEFEKSWTALFLWMNENGYKKADQEPYEIYHNDYREHPDKKFVVDLCIPVL